MGENPGINWQEVGCEISCGVELSRRVGLRWYRKTCRAMVTQSAAVENVICRRGPHYVVNQKDRKVGRVEVNLLSQRGNDGAGEVCVKPIDIHNSQGTTRGWRPKKQWIGYGDSVYIRNLQRQRLEKLNWLKKYVVNIVVFSQDVPEVRPLKRVIICGGANIGPPKDEVRSTKYR